MRACDNWKNGVFYFSICLWCESETFFSYFRFLKIKDRLQKCINSGGGYIGKEYGLCKISAPCDMSFVVRIKFIASPLHNVSLYSIKTVLYDVFGIQLTLQVTYKTLCLVYASHHE